eukprot:3709446-Prymnesium_polylepis.1
MACVLIWHVSTLTGPVSYREHRHVEEDAQLARRRRLVMRLRVRHLESDQQADRAAQPRPPEHDPVGHVQPRRRAAERGPQQREALPPPRPGRPSAQPASGGFDATARSGAGRSPDQPTDR